jgi:hypothetical protein
MPQFDKHANNPFDRQLLSSPIHCLSFLDCATRQKLPQAAGFQALLLDRSDDARVTQFVIFNNSFLGKECVVCVHDGGKWWL